MYACDVETCVRQSEYTGLLPRTEPTARNKQRNALCTAAVLENEILQSNTMEEAHRNLQYGCHVQPHVIFPSSDEGLSPVAF